MTELLNLLADPQYATATVNIRRSDAYGYMVALHRFRELVDSDLGVVRDGFHHVGEGSTVDDAIKALIGKLGR